jgi:hypothetical protein
MSTQASDPPPLPKIDLWYGDGDGGEALASLVAGCFEHAKTSDIPPWPVFDLKGMSGRRYRLFINTLIHRLSDPRYLEIGIWNGSTLCAAIFQNAIRAVAIDNWSEFGSPKEEFEANLARFRGEQTQVTVLEGDFRRVDYSGFGGFNVYLFDGPHSERDQFDGLRLPLAAMDESFVCIVDDWNWPAVRSGTLKAIAALGLIQKLTITVRTTWNDQHPNYPGELGGCTDWHNGYFIAVLRKPQHVPVA